MQSEPNKDDRPPFFRNWSGFYALVLGNLAITILLLYIFSRVYE
jgi:hypothetical protein